MNDSMIDAAAFIQEVIDTVNTVPSIPENVVVVAINDLVSCLFGQVIRPIRFVRTVLETEGDLLFFDPKSITTPSTEATMVAEDVVCLFSENETIHKAPTDHFFALSIPMYCVMNEKIYLRNIETDTVIVCYVARPLPIRYENETYSGNICMPEGYRSLLAAGLCAELYRYIGDEQNCRLYTEKYNTKLADLKAKFGDSGGGEAV